MTANTIQAIGIALLTWSINCNAGGELWGGGNVEWIPMARIRGTEAAQGALSPYGVPVVLYDPSKAYSVPVPLMKFLLKRAEGTAILEGAKTSNGARSPDESPTPLGYVQVKVLGPELRQAECYAAKGLSTADREAITQLVVGSRFDRVLYDNFLTPRGLTMLLSEVDACQAN